MAEFRFGLVSATLQPVDITVVRLEVLELSD